MERIKAICSLILYSSAIIFCTTFVDAIYPKGLCKGESYNILMEQYQKILDNSSIEEKDATSFLSEEEFTAHIDRSVVVEKVQLALDNTDLYRITLEDEQRVEISEQFAKLYDQQIAALENTEYNAAMGTVRFIAMVLLLLCGAINIVIDMKYKNMKKIKQVEDKKVKEKITEPKEEEIVKEEEIITEEEISDSNEEDSIKVEEVLETSIKESKKVEKDSESKEVKKSKPKKKSETKKKNEPKKKSESKKKSEPKKTSKGDGGK